MTPIVLLHGIGGALWAPTRPALAPAPVLEWDLPGYAGTSPVPALTFPALADALLGMLDGAGHDRVDLLGHSFGGMLAQEVAARAPERVRRLVLYATTPAFGGRDPAFAEQFLAERLAPLDRGTTMRALAEAGIPPLTEAGAAPGARQYAVDTMAAVPADAYRAVLRCLTTFDRRDALGAIAAPTLLVAGEEDTLAPFPTMLRMSLAIPGAKLHVLPGAGHWAHLQQPAAFNAAVAEFLRREE